MAIFLYSKKLLTLCLLSFSLCKGMLQEFDEKNSLVSSEVFLSLQGNDFKSLELAIEKNDFKKVETWVVEHIDKRVLTHINSELQSNLKTWNKQKLITLLRKLKENDQSAYNQVMQGLSKLKKMLLNKSDCVPKRIKDFPNILNIKPVVIFGLVLCAMIATTVLTRPGAYLLGKVCSGGQACLIIMLTILLTCFVIEIGVGGVWMKMSSDSSTFKKIKTRLENYEGFFDAVVKELDYDDSFEKELDIV